MYESRFGMTGLPFQLSPDPVFYFDSQGHHCALAQLRLGLKQTSGAIVVSGEVGAGKTTLVRTVLGELDTDRVAVGHIVSSQLSANDVLIAALRALGHSKISGASLADNSSRLVRRVLKLAKARRRCLLIIDEAQNLTPAALLPLAALITRTGQKKLSLQLCLVGQPELQDHLLDPELRGLRDVVRVSCHLGPLVPEEIGPYVEHRLRKVGWSGLPAFRQESFDEIYRWTGGLPRRINVLCNRLMLACFLSQITLVDEDLVAHTAREREGEWGMDDARPLAELPPRHAAPAKARPAAATAGMLLCVASSPTDHVKAAVLMRAVAATHTLGPARLVRVHHNDALELTRALFDAQAADSVIEMGIRDDGGGMANDRLAPMFRAVIAQARPSAVIVFDGTDVALACATVAHDEGVPVVHVGAGARTADADSPHDQTARATDALADLLYTTDAIASQALEREALPAERSHCAGSLLVDALVMAASARWPLPDGRSGASPAEQFLSERGYALVLIEQPVHLADTHTLSALVNMVREVSRDIPAVWPICAALHAKLHALRLEKFSDTERIIGLPVQAYAEHVGLLRHATCVVTDSWQVQEEATALGVPCFTIGRHPCHPITCSIGSNTPAGMNGGAITRLIWECLFNGGKRGRMPMLWDGKASSRIANFLAAWLPPVPADSAARSGEVTDRASGIVGKREQVSS
jgi:UDP-N-acetylglucosamine 2-epimerase